MTCAGPFLSLSPRGSPIYIKHREKRRADKERVKILSGARHTRWPPANCRSRLCARELSLLANLRRRHLMASTLETRLCAQKCTFCVSPFGCMVLCGKTAKPKRERHSSSAAFLFFVAAPFFIIHFQAPP